MADGQHFSGHDNNIGKAQDNGPAKDAPSPFHAELQQMQGKPEATKTADASQTRDAAQEAPKAGDNTAAKAGDAAVAKASDHPPSKTEDIFNNTPHGEGIENAYNSMNDKLHQVTQPHVRAEMVAQLQKDMEFHAERNAAQGLGSASLANYMPAFTKTA